MKTKRLLSVLLAVIMVIGLLPSTAFAAEDSTDIPEGAEVVTIGSAADFDDFAAAVNYDNPTPSGSDGYYQGFKASWNKNLYVKITADIDMSEVTFTTAIGSYGNGGGFSGTLDGCGHTLSNYKVSGNWNYARALFRQAEDITVKNITFDNFVSDAKGVADNKTRPAGAVFASVLGTKNVFENVTVTNSVCYGDNGLGILTGYGSGDYYNTYVTEYTFTNCTVKNCTIYSETDRAAVLGEFGRDGDVILTISDCTFENNTLHANIGGVTTTSDLPVWYCHGEAYIERDGVFYTYEHFGYAEEGEHEQVEVNYALKAAKSGDTIIVVQDVDVTEAEAEYAFAKSVDINKGKTDSTASDGYAWDTEGNLVKIIAKIGEDDYWDLDDAIDAADASKGDEIVIVSDTEITAEQAEAAFAKSVNIYRDGAEGIDIIISDLYDWDTDNKLVMKPLSFVVNADKEEYGPGETIRITVTYSGAAIYGYTYKLNYEDNKVTLVSKDNVADDNLSVNEHIKDAAGAPEVSNIYTFTAKEFLTPNTKAEFTLTSATVTTNSTPGMGNSIVADVTDDTITILGKINVTEPNGGLTVEYNGKTHNIPTITTDLTGATVTYKVNGGKPTTNPTATDAGTYTVEYTVTMDGYQTVTGTYTFTVTPHTLSKDDFTIDTTEKPYTGEKVEPDVTSDKLQDSDYTVEYDENTDAGTATITITPTGGNVVGDPIKVTFKIAKAPLIVAVNDATVLLGDPLDAAVTYTISGWKNSDGAALEDTLRQGLTYDVSGSSNVAGAACTVTPKLTDAYTSTWPDDLKNYEVNTFNPGTLTILGKITVIKPEDGLTVEYNGKPHSIPTITTEPAGATVTYTVNDGKPTTDPTATDADTYTVKYTVTMDDYQTVTGTYTFTVTPHTLSEDDFNIDTADKPYTGQEIKPDVTSDKLQDSDYTVEYDENTDAGTATITIRPTGGNVIGDPIKVTFKIAKAPLTVAVNNADVLLGDPLNAAVTYTITGWKNSDGDALEGTLRQGLTYEMSGTGNAVGDTRTVTPKLTEGYTSRWPDALKNYEVNTFNPGILTIVDLTEGAAPNGQYVIEIIRADAEAGTDDYINGFALVLVYTDKNVTFDYGGALMVDTQKQNIYKYNGMDSYAHVYAAVVQLTEGAPDNAAIKSKVKTHASIPDTGDLRKLSTAENEVNQALPAIVDNADLVCASGSLNSDMYKYYISAPYILIAADVNGDKRVDNKDTNAVKSAGMPK